MTREQKLILNTGSGCVYQLISIISGFILPRLIIGTFGSDINGLVHSVAQLLGFITLFEMGIYSVISASLYKPLADKDYVQISKIYKSSQKFFNKIGLIFAGYVMLLAVWYPFFAGKEFDFFFIFFLIFVLSISTFAQYFLGISCSIILGADQLQYLNNLFRSLTLLVSTIVSVVLVKAGYGIHVIKLAAAVIFLIQPVFMKIYVDRHYHIVGNIHLNEEPIKQKWDGLAQHIAFYVTTSTDTIVLTLFSTLSNVSIYSVYALVLNGVTGFLESVTTSLSPYFGNMIVKNEMEALNRKFSYLEWAVHQGVTFIYTATAILIVPFVKIYTKGINDADYIVPVFALVITIAYALRTLRIPYNSMVIAAGHFKQTQLGSVIEALVNIIISIAGVCMFGLVGVAAGTVAAMLCRTIYLVWYLSKYIISRKISFWLKNVATDLSVCIAGSVAAGFLDSSCSDYWEWVLYAAKVSLIILFFCFFLNVIFNREFVAMIKEKIR